MRRRWLLLAVILTAPSGCDNVTWGGTEVRLEGPAGQGATAPSEAEAAAPADTVPELPQGPILLAGTRDGDTLTLASVGVIRGSELTELPAEAATPDYMARLTEARFPTGSEVILFSGGARVGRMTVARTDAQSGTCGLRVTVRGVAELVPGAAPARRFLALADPGATARPFTPWRAVEDDYDQRVASLSIAGETIPQVRAPWPKSVLDSRADMQAFRLPEASDSFFAATFVYEDRLSVSRPGTDAWALFIMGAPGQGGYRSAFTWYRRASEDGKGAPRYFDHLDWDGDGTSEILLDVFGAEQRWYAALDQRNGTWVRSFQDACGATGS